jgi:hypothetical protein
MCAFVHHVSPNELREGVYGYTNNRISNRDTNKASCILHQRHHKMGRGRT